MPLNLNFRVAESKDLESVQALYEFLNPDDQKLSEDDARSLWQRILRTDSVTVLLGELENQVVTTCTLIIVPNLTRGGRSYAVIENVVTDPALRKRGLGTAILGEAVRRAQGANCYKVVLTTGSKRESTLAFYEKAGFSRNSRTAFEWRF